MMNIRGFNMDRRARRHLDVCVNVHMYLLRLRQVNCEANPCTRNGLRDLLLPVFSEIKESQIFAGRVFDIIILSSNTA